MARLDIQLELEGKVVHTRVWMQTSNEENAQHSDLVLAGEEDVIESKNRV